MYKNFIFKYKNSAFKKKLPHYSKNSEKINGAFENIFKKNIFLNDNL